MYYDVKIKVTPIDPREPSVKYKSTILKGELLEYINDNVEVLGMEVRRMYEERHEKMYRRYDRV